MFCLSAAREASFFHGVSQSFKPLQLIRRRIFHTSGIE
jgi:hypothetical protein